MIWRRSTAFIANYIEEEAIATVIHRKYRRALAMFIRVLPGGGSTQRRRRYFTAISAKVTRCRAANAVQRLCLNISTHYVMPHSAPSNARRIYCVCLMFDSPAPTRLSHTDGGMVIPAESHVTASTPTSVSCFRSAPYQIVIRISEGYIVCANSLAIVPLSST